MKRFFIGLGAVIIIASIIGTMVMFNKIGDLSRWDLLYEMAEGLKTGALCIGIGGVLLGIIFIGMGYIMDQIDGVLIAIRNK